MEVVPALGSGEVRLRWIPCEGLSEGEVARLRTVLSDEERERADRFHFARDRVVYTAAHALTRHMLAEATGTEPGQARLIPFRLNPWGKPEIDRPNNRLRFSLTHTRGLAACAVTLDADLGLDAEAPEARGDVLRIADHAFAPSEAAALRALPPDELRPAFLRLWTLKEAFLKAIGRGLSIPPADAVFALAPLEPLRVGCERLSDPDPMERLSRSSWSEVAKGEGAPAFACRPGLGVTAEDWAFEALTLEGGHAVAVALHHPEGGGIALDRRAVAAGEVAGQVPG